MGVQVYRTETEIVDGNLGRALSALKPQIAFWRILLLATAGPIALAKMVVLPRMLYYYANLPFIIPKCHFKELDELMLDLVWSGRRPRMAFATLKR